MHITFDSRSKFRPSGALRLLVFSCCLAFAYALAPAEVLHAEETIDEAETAYAKGRFKEAAGIGESLGTSQGFALAAKSLTIHAYYLAREDEKKKLLERAVKLAKKAVLSDPKNADAHLQLSRAVGRHAETLGKLEAAGQAKKIREAAEKALEVDPGLAAAHISLGRWHAEVVSTMGFMAGITYGAKKEDALAHLEKAAELAPDSKDMPLQYALGLLALDEFKYREKAKKLLAQSVKRPAKDAYERLLHAEAVDLLESLDAPEEDEDDDY